MSGRVLRLLVVASHTDGYAVGRCGCAHTHHCALQASPSPDRAFAAAALPAPPSCYLLVRGRNIPFMPGTTSLLYGTPLLCLFYALPPAIPARRHLCRAARSAPVVAAAAGCAARLLVYIPPLAVLLRLPCMMLPQRTPPTRTPSTTCHTAHLLPCAAHTLPLHLHTHAHFCPLPTAFARTAPHPAPQALPLPPRAPPAASLLCLCSLVGGGGCCLRR